MIRAVLASVFFFCAGSMPATAQQGQAPIDDRLVAMAAHVSAKASHEGFLGSIAVPQTTFTSMTIGKLDGTNVCAKKNFQKAKRLQELFNEEPDIYENHGPAFRTVTDRSGHRKSVAAASDKCPPIYVSVQPQ
jgi:hypothetical protein